MKTVLLFICMIFSTGALAADFRARLPEDEVVYFLLPDRFENGDATNDTGGLSGGPLQTGFDPAHKGFYHGGDLAGLAKRLEYIQQLGATAIWLAPIFKNKAVQGAPGSETAGYHGYWVTDFTTVDPHFGSEADFKSFVDAAHARGMKVYMDIITNHTADVIYYRECTNAPCPYRARADYPYSRRASDGVQINPGFAGDSVQTPQNFARLVDPTFAYTPLVPDAEKNLKKPAWLNDPIYYHNRGNSTFSGENSTMGDFAGLDDLMTENPRVLQGFIDVYGAWIDKYKVDGFRIDTAKHVNPEFWQAFVPAMRARARKNGIPNFHIFGEVYTDGSDFVSQIYHTQVAHLPAVLDFAFMRAAILTASGKSGTDIWSTVFMADPLYTGKVSGASQLPTFLGNHDAGRFALAIKQANPTDNDADILRRVMLGHAMLITLRGVPVIYAGDEQGFIGDGNDQDAREDMFPSSVASYNDNDLVGTTATTALSNFDASHPLYQIISKLSGLRKNTPALRRGMQTVRNTSNKPGLLAISRRDAQSGNEILLLFNTSNAPLKANVEIPAGTNHISPLHGNCPATPWSAGSISVALAPLDFAICSVSHK